MVLLGEGVLGLGEDAAKGIVVEGVEVGEQGEPADKLGDESEMLEVHGKDVAEHVVLVDFLTGVGAVVADDVGLDAGGYVALDAVESTAGDEEDVAGVDLNHGLLGVFAATLGRHVDHGPLEEFEHGLLDSFTRNVAGDGGVVALAGNLVDLVNKDDAAFGSRHVVVGSLEEAHEDIFDIVAHVAGLGEGGGISDTERHVEHAGNGACHKGFAGAGFTNYDDVGFLNFDIVVVVLVLAEVFQTFVVVVDRDGKDPFGIVLADDVLVEVVLDLLWGGYGFGGVELG